MSVIKKLFKFIEQVNRIEHKLDLLLEGQAMENPNTSLLPFGDPQHIDPLTQQPVRYKVDPLTGMLTREGSGSLGMAPPIEFPAPAPVPGRDSFWRTGPKPQDDLGDDEQ